MKRFGRLALVIAALTLLVSGCLPVSKIQDKISGAKDGTTQIGPT